MHEQDNCRVSSAHCRAQGCPHLTSPGRDPQAWGHTCSRRSPATETREGAVALKGYGCDSFLWVKTLVKEIISRSGFTTDLRPRRGRPSAPRPGSRPLCAPPRLSSRPQPRVPPGGWRLAPGKRASASALRWVGAGLWGWGLRAWEPRSEKPEPEREAARGRLYLAGGRSTGRPRCSRAGPCRPRCPSAGAARPGSG